jgi:hypothetical protein
MRILYFPTRIQHQDIHHQTVHHHRTQAAPLSKPASPRYTSTSMPKDASPLWLDACHQTHRLLVMIAEQPDEHGHARQLVDALASILDRLGAQVA